MSGPFVSLEKDDGSVGGDVHKPVGVSFNLLLEGYLAGRVAIGATAPGHLVVDNGRVAAFVWSLTSDRGGVALTKVHVRASSTSGA